MLVLVHFHTCYVNSARDRWPRENRFPHRSTLLQVRTRAFSLSPSLSRSFSHSLHFPNRYISFYLSHRYGRFSLSRSTIKTDTNARCVTRTRSCFLSLALALSVLNRALRRALTKYIPDGSQTTTTTKIVRQARQTPNALAKQPSARVCSQCTFSRPYRRKHSSSSSAAHHHHTVGFAVFCCCCIGVCVRACVWSPTSSRFVVVKGWVGCTGGRVGWTRSSNIRAGARTDGRGCYALPVAQRCFRPSDL